MVNSINSNSGAFLGVRELNQTSSTLDRIRERITTGRAVNGPRDDAATFAIAQALSGQIAGTTAVQGALSAGASGRGCRIDGRYVSIQSFERSERRCPSGESAKS